MTRGSRLKGQGSGLRAQGEPLRLETGNWKLGTGNWQLAAGSWQLAAKSQNQHRVPVAIKVIAVLDRLAIGIENLLSTRECRHQHQEGRSGKMKVRQKTIDDLKPVAGINEQ